MESAGPRITASESVPSSVPLMCAASSVPLKVPEFAVTTPEMMLF
jgi:hypothetical protein